MINARVRTRESAPAWAVLGAPLIGVPLLVALLALASGGGAAPDAPDDVLMAVETVAEEEAAPRVVAEGAEAMGVDHGPGCTSGGGPPHLREG